MTPAGRGGHDPWVPNPHYPKLLNDFMLGTANGHDPRTRLPAASLFSNGGVGDFGYEAAGFSFFVHAEKSKRRCDVLRKNYPGSAVVEGDLNTTWRSVVDEYRRATQEELALLAASPPCQGMSTANQTRHNSHFSKFMREDDRNYLYKVVPLVVAELRPRCVVVENVPGILNTGIRGIDGAVRTVAQDLQHHMPGYSCVVANVQMAEYGIPQSRLRTFFIFARDDQAWFRDLVEAKLTPFPKPTHGDGREPWVTARQALSNRFAELDARSREGAWWKQDYLHRVSVLDRMHYEWVDTNPPGAGKSCYQSLVCDRCGRDNGPEPKMRCGNQDCKRTLIGVPRTKDKKTGLYRLVKGRLTAYRRIPPNAPAPTITTASGHLGSDYTIHPYANRILSARECAELQSIPVRFGWVDWKPRHLISEIRDIIGEAIPPFFTYLLGSRLRDLLTHGAAEDVMPATDASVVSLVNPLVPIVHGVRPGGRTRLKGRPAEAGARA